MIRKLINFFLISATTTVLAISMVSCGKSTEKRQEGSGSEDTGVSAGVSGCTTETAAIRTTTQSDSNDSGAGDVKSSGAASPYLTQSTSAVTFQKSIKKLIENSCLECHSRDTKLQKPFLDTYDQVRNAAVSSLQRMEANTMPPPAGTDKPNETELDDFRTWISEGFLYGPDSERRTASNPSSAYNNEIRDFLKAECISCHKADGSQSPNLTTFDSSRTFGSRVFARVKEGTMPPKSDINPEWVDMVSRWRASGYSLNNDLTKSSSSSDSQSEDSSVSNCANE